MASLSPFAFYTRFCACFEHQYKTSYGRRVVTSPIGQPVPKGVLMTTTAGPVKPNTLPPGQLFDNVGPLVPPSTAQSISASSVPPMGAQITVSNSSGGVQNQGGSMSVSMSAAGMNNFTPGSIQPTRRPTQEDLINAKRWVDEKKKVAFSGEFSLLRLSRL
jgi:hypothetical protein